ncbi:hypothetical protein ThrDRAFT_00551 [Frankia casuarinae]|nr:hypothetical protein CcI6DRAFT_00685 [Frankia sp. CcI6]EYT93800.1 hypothetical protein ThrDRAFT_00551 [Frankia casuarinae]KDA44444.1 hypothetical protein BMG523Draft_00619 [Frankia sp. BMG5.23]KEZ37187.1 hypothetical protein CEDDRAFT_01440 [Frankia sp. CeD]KFB04427.1 hypothetical protein ALLO2DRAFT_02879 [Frankia sp. Allo2]
MAWSLRDRDALRVIRGSRPAGRLVVTGGGSHRAVRLRGRRVPTRVRTSLLARERACGRDPWQRYRMVLCRLAVSLRTRVCGIDPTAPRASHASDFPDFPGSGTG